MRHEMENTKEMTGVMHTQCSDCGKYLGGKPCTKELDGLISHGSCPECAKKQLKELDRLLGKKEERDVLAEAASTYI